MEGYIRFVKENDLFTWEVGDVLEIDAGCVRVETGNDKLWTVFLDVRDLVERGYAEYFNKRKVNNRVRKQSPELKEAIRLVEENGYIVATEIILK